MDIILKETNTFKKNDNNINEMEKSKQVVAILNKLDTLLEICKNKK